ncbi:MAG: hypothetical protein ABFD97_23680 [Syntrophobacter sp.]
MADRRFFLGIVLALSQALLPRGAIAAGTRNNMGPVAPRANRSCPRDWLDSAS